MAYHNHERRVVLRSLEAVVGPMLLGERQKDVDDGLMLGHVREEANPLEKERIVARLFPALRQPRAVEEGDALGKGVLGTDVPKDCAASAGNRLRDDAVRVLGNWPVGGRTHVESKVLGWGVGRAGVEDVESRADARGQRVLLSPLDKAAHGVAD